MRGVHQHGLGRQEASEAAHDGGPARVAALKAAQSIEALAEHHHKLTADGAAQETFDDIVDRTESSTAASSSSDYDSDDDDSDDDDTDDTDDDERVSRKGAESRRARLARLEAVRDADEANMIMLSLSLRRQREQQE